MRCYGTILTPASRAGVGLRFPRLTPWAIVCRPLRGFNAPRQVGVRRVCRPLRGFNALRSLRSSKALCPFTARTLAIVIVLLLSGQVVFGHLLDPLNSAATTAGFRDQAPPSQTKSQPSSTRKDAPHTPAKSTPALDPALAAAEALVQRGLLSDAEARTRRFLDAHPESAEGHYLLGYILFAEIRQQYEREEKKEGASFRYNDSVSASLAATRDAKARESLAELSAGARYHAPSAFDLKIVALDYLLLKDNPAAEKWLSESVKLNPNDAQAWFYLGRTQYSETKYAAAIEAFEHCLKADPKNVEAEYNVGLSYEGLKQQDEALQAYQNAIAWQSGGAMKSPDPFVAIGRLYLSRNQPDKAVPYLAQAVAAFPQISLAHEELGKAYSTLQRLPEARAELEKAVQLSPDRASLRCVLGEVYTREHMAARAKVEFARCSALQNAQTAGASDAQPH